MPTVEATKTVPRNALRFNAGPFKFTPAEDGKSAPVHVLARSSQPIMHWYWGKVVHDMDGFQVSDSIPLDYCHYDDEVLGFLDKFTKTLEGLECDGQMVSFKQDDRAAEIIYKSSKNVPYQASIFFDQDYLVLEEVGPGMKSQVNGYAIDGPALIIRQWKLLGVAICPYGADSNTSTSFAKKIDGEVTVKFISQEKDSKMSTDAAKKEDQKPSENNVSREQISAEIAKFTTAFGAVNGVAWFTQGKTFDQAMELHAGELNKQLEASKTELSTKLAEKDQQITDLNTKLSTAKGQLGETEKLTGGEGDKKPAEKSKFSNLPEGSAKFAETINLPKKK